MGELILTEARKLFFSYGLKSVSMDDLAKNAGISKKTIYQFFADKNELVSRIVEDLLHRHHLQFFECIDKASDPVDEVITVADQLSGSWSPVSHGFFHELEKSFPEAWKKIENYREEVFRPWIINNLEKGIAGGWYREELDVPLTATIRLQQLISIFQTDVFARRRMKPKQANYELTVFYLHAITTENGKKLLSKYLKKKNENTLDN